MLFKRLLRLLVWVLRFEVVKKEFGLFSVLFILRLVVSLFWILDIMLVVCWRVRRFWCMLVDRLMLDMVNFFFWVICIIVFFE